MLERIARVPGASRLLGRPDAWFVGGAVRDALLGAPIRDLDLVVEGGAIALAAELGPVVEAHERFGTAEVLVDGTAVNLADARRETYAHPGALPDVEPASVADDLARRDFTINAIAVRADGEGLLAHPAAFDDLGAGLLRVLHAGSFADDPTRALRLARYGARLGLAIEPETQVLARAADLGTVSGERVGTELRLALAEPDPVAALRAIRGLGMLTWLEPRESLPFGDPGTRALAAAVSQRDPEEVRERLDALGMPARLRDIAVATAAHAALPGRMAAVTRPSEIAALCRALPVEAAAALGLERWLGALHDVRTLVTGDDLIAAGVAQGPDVGARLQRTLDAVLDEELAPDDRDAQLAFALA